MRIMKRLLVFGFACVSIVCAMVTFAQDDLDNLLNDLESDGKKSAPAPAEAKPAVEEKKESETPAEPAAESAPVAAAETPDAEKKEEATTAPAEPVAAPVAAAPAPVAEPEAPVTEKKEEVATATQAAAPVEEGTPQKEVSNSLDDLASVPGDKKRASAVEPAVSTATAEAPAPAAASAPAPVASSSSASPAAVAPMDPNMALISDLMAAEALRREAMDLQAERELTDARAAMANRDWETSYKKYALAFKHLNDRADSADWRKECEQGMAESRYQAGRQAFREGNHERARELAVEARSLRHPRAQALIEALDGDLASADEKDITAIAHRRNDKDYKSGRDSIRRRLRLSAQYLAVSDLDKALEECELVIRYDPYNREALDLRQRIQRRRDVILDKERHATREGMIADVNAAWRPVYAVNSLEVKGIDGGTTRTALGNDSERTVEQLIEKRMKEMILPSISFRPPATIADAVEYFKQASRDFDRPDIPIDQRGFNFVLDLGKQLVSKGGEAGDEDSGNDFSASGNNDAASSGGSSDGMPLIPAIAANNVSLWDALKLVCRVTKFKFQIQEGPVVMVMPESMTTEDLVTRTYDVTENFAERMSGAAEDVQDMKGGFGGGNKSNDDNAGDDQEASWKKFFSLMGVKWAEGSSIVYLKTIGKLRVTNTKDQLAVIEAALAGELGATPKLIEIEARFVEVAQEDLNSLGFEWLLNSDYSFGLNGKLGKLLGIRGGKWGSETGSDTYSTGNGESYSHSSTSTKTAGGDSNIFKNGDVVDAGSSWDQTTVAENKSAISSIGMNESYKKSSQYSTTTLNGQHQGANWSRNHSGKRNMGLVGDPTTYQSGMRYLSTDSNHITGEGYSKNDQFMRVNAFLGNADLSMILHMLSQRSDTDLLSAPKVLTGPGKEATMKVVTEYIYPTEYDVQLTASGGSSSSSSGGGGSSEILAVVEPENFTTREVGVILQVTPELSQGGQLINLHLQPRVVSEPTWKNYGMRIPKSSNSQYNAFDSVANIMNSLVNNILLLGGTLSNEEIADYRSMLRDSATTSINAINSGENTLSYYDAPMEQPFFKTRSIETDITIANGATVVMGGLITEERKSMEDKIPFLGDIPWIGRFFRSRSEWSNKRNLLIFVTARLVDPMGRQISMGVTEETSAEEAKVTAAPEG